MAKAPTNTQWQRNLSVTHYKIGEVLKATTIGRGAISYTAASAIMDRLAAQDRNNKQWQDEAAQLRATLAACCTPKATPSAPPK